MECPQCLDVRWFGECFNIKGFGYMADFKRLPKAFVPFWYCEVDDDIHLPVKLSPPLFDADE